MMSALRQEMGTCMQEYIFEMRVIYVVPVLTCLQCDDTVLATLGS